MKRLPKLTNKKTRHIVIVGFILLFVAIYTTIYLPSKKPIMATSANKILAKSADEKILYIVDDDGTNYRALKTIPANDPHKIGTVDLSHDRTVALWNEENGTAEKKKFYKCNVSSCTPTQIIPGGNETIYADIGHPDLSPDKTTIVFTLYPNNPVPGGDPWGHSQIYTMNVNGGNLQRLTPGGTDFDYSSSNDAEWSPIGDKVTFKSTYGATQTEKNLDKAAIFYVTVPQGQLFRLTAWSSNHDPSWSPEAAPGGVQIAFSRYQGSGAWLDPGNDTHDWYIYKYNLTTGVTTQLAAPIGEFGINSLPVYSPSGSIIMYYTNARIQGDTGCVNTIPVYKMSASTGQSSRSPMWNNNPELCSQFFDWK